MTCTDDEALAAFRRLCETEGIVPALEPSHALARALDWTATRSSSASRAAATRISPRPWRTCDEAEGPDGDRVQAVSKTLVIYLMAGRRVRGVEAEYRACVAFR